ncbi:hypothetical protein CYMTET_45456 [Cymbomonas tetramitiformis]|uniref:EF-hand domain-containing protein n=1 Tax=Cymbomonas tetramitiformis TaxID=36881 RepID=A0AAE0BZI5_9CHLO|nr:hypothetical protein CYMTET_45456 [Cymbomonas tetramitiformis]
MRPTGCGLNRHFAGGGVGRYMMGRVKSSLYDAMMTEKLNFKMEYARFAAKAILASAVFDMMDSNRGGSLSKSELFMLLRRVTRSQGMDVALTGSLVEFMMSVADTGEEDATDAASAEEEASINREEWVNVFVGPPCTVDDCIAVIQQANERGKYIIPPAELNEFNELNDDLTEQIKKEIEEGEIQTDLGLKEEIRLLGTEVRRQDVVIKKMRRALTAIPAQPQAKVHKDDTAKPSLFSGWDLGLLAWMQEEPLPKPRPPPPEPSGLDLPLWEAPEDDEEIVYGRKKPPKHATVGAAVGLPAAAQSTPVRDAEPPGREPVGRQDVPLEEGGVELRMEASPLAPASERAEPSSSFGIFGESRGGAEGWQQMPGAEVHISPDNTMGTAGGSAIAKSPGRHPSRRSELPSWAKDDAAVGMPKAETMMNVKDYWSQL